MTRDEIRRRLSTLGTWKRGDERAPHKPLLLLLALARAGRNESRLARFREIHEPLTRLLKDFGPPRKSHHPEFPFWWLRTDGLWEIPRVAALAPRKGGKNPTKSELLRREAEGGLPDEVFRQVAGDKNRAFRDELVAQILVEHFPASMHQELLDATGVDLGLEIVPDIGVPTRFRTEVIQAYEHRCAVCGYDLKLGDVDFGLDAAHIKWRACRGPDIVPNGLALCAGHHRALDRGAIGFDEGRTLLISEKVHGYGEVWTWFLAFAGKPLRSPSRADLAPRDEFLDWHRREVFLGMPRG